MNDLQTLNAALAPTEEEAFRELRFALEGRDSPAIVLAVFDTERQRLRLLQDFIALLPEYEHLLLDFTAQTVHSPYAAILQHPAYPRNLDLRGEGRYVLHLIDLDKTLLVEITTPESERVFLPNLNMERERLFRSIPAILVFWLTPYSFAKIRSQAPDFFDWVTLRYEFKARPEELASTPETNIPSVPLYEPGINPERQKRINHLLELQSKIALRTASDYQIAYDNQCLLAQEYSKAENYLKASKAWEMADVFWQHLQDPTEILRANLYLEWAGNLYNARKYEDALAKLIQAENIYEKLGSEVALAQVYHRTGSVNTALRHWDVAMENFQKAIKLYEKTGHLSRLNHTFHEIGTNYALQGKWAPALEYYQKAVEWGLTGGNPDVLGRHYHKIGDLYQSQRLWNSALENYQKSLDFQPDPE